MNKKSKFKQIMAVRGMGAALTAFVGLIVIYVAFGLIQPQVFSVRNVLNLLRSPVYPDRHADRGKHEFTYALYGHRGKLSVETLKRAYQLNKPLLQFTGDHLPCPLVRSTNETVVVETIKKAYGKDALVIRLFESQGKDAVTGIETGFSYRDVQEVNLMEEHPQAVETDSLVFAPFEIKTLLFTL